MLLLGLGSRTKFEPEILQVTEGDRVRLTLHSTDTQHGFTIKKLNVKVAVPKTGESVTVETFLRVVSIFRVASFGLATWKTFPHAAQDRSAFSRSPKISRGTRWTCPQY